MEIARSGKIRSCAPMFFSDRLVREGAMLSSARCYHHGGECHGNRDPRTINGDSSLRGDEKLAW
jgi:hypothetical protein